MRAALWGLSLAGACNQAPLVWPDDAWAPEGSAPWYHPSDRACEQDHPDEEIVVVDGYRYCGATDALENILPVDDPVYARCNLVPPGDDRPVMSVFDGQRARAYALDALFHREIVHTDWDGQAVLVNYCAFIAGGDVFYRQERDGQAVRYNVVGLWGSANTVAPRHEIYTPERDYTAYTTWDGHALLGPGRPGRIEKFPVLVDYIGLDEFLDRYGALGETCEVWAGQEELGVQCEEACARYLEACPTADLRQCERQCAWSARSTTDCMMAAQTCEAQYSCRARPPQ